MRTERDVVLDASAAVELLLGSASGRAVDRMLGPQPALHVPELFFVEVQAALRGAERVSKLSPARAAAAVEDVAALPCIRWSHATVLLERAWALRGSVSAYDAIYVALAERLGATLVTADARLAAAVRQQSEVAVATPT